MAGIVNPLSALGGFQNQQLSRFTNPNNSARPAAAAPAGFSEVPQEDLSGFGRISERASRQHSMFLTALQAQQARRQPQKQTSPSGGGYRSQGGGGALGGRYGLVSGADRALQGLSAAFRQQFGHDLKVNSGGRSYAEQARLYALYKAGKGNLAAPPGKSVHNSGRAVDFGGAIQNAGSREHRWLQQNAGRWGYKWTGKNFSQVEPWHWEWQG